MEKFNNKLVGKVKVFGGGLNDLPGRLIINHPADLPSSVFVRAISDFDLPSQVNITYSNQYDVESVVDLRLPYDLPSSVVVRPWNRVVGKVEVVPPPIFTVSLSPVEDTHARSNFPKLNYGKDHDTFVGVGYNGEVYRSFFRFDISSIPTGKIIKSATLVLQRLNSTPATTIGIYEINPQDNWDEYGLTWDNQPRLSNLIKTVDSGTYAGVARIDLTSYVSEWYSGAKEHNGIALKALLEEVAGTFKQYGTRESDLPPYLEIEYYDPNVFSFGKYDLTSRVFIFSTGAYDIVGSVIVNGYVGEDDLESTIDVRDPKEPVNDDLESVVHITKDTLPSQVIVVGNGEDDLLSVINVRQAGADEITGSVVVSKPELPGDIVVNPYDDLTSSVYVNDKDDLPSEVAINRPELPATLEITPYDDLYFVVTVQVTEIDDLPSEVWVNRPELPGWVDVPPYDDLVSEIVVRVHREDDLPGYVVVNRPELFGSVNVTPYKDLPGSVTVAAVDYADLASTIFIISDHINACVIVRAAGQHDLDSEIYIKGFENEDLPSSVTVRREEDHDLPSSVAVRVKAFDDLPSTVVPRVTGAYDIPTEVEVEIAYNLPSSVVIRRTEGHDLPSQVTVRFTLSDDLPSTVLIGSDDDGYAFIM